MDKVRLRAAKTELDRVFAGALYVEPAKGTFGQAKAYCEKDGDYTDFGVPPAQGKRSDLEEVATQIKSGVSVADAVKDHPGVFIRYSKGLSQWAQLYQKQRDFKTKVVWCYGPTGTGKTRWIQEKTGGTAYWKSGRTKWWCGYANEDDVVIDDFRPSAEMPLDYMLRLFDRYPFNVECKGGAMKFNSKTIYVTAPWTLEELYAKVPFDIPEEDIRQLVRRVDEFHHFPDGNHLLANRATADPDVVTH